MHRTRLTALALVALVGCKEDPKPPAAVDAAPSKSAESSTPENVDSPPEPPPEKPAEPADGGVGSQAASLIDRAAAEAAGAPMLPHDGILGHVMMPNFVDTLDKVQKQAAPPSSAGMVNLGFLQLMASSSLGSRSAVATNIDFAKPFGCAWVDTKEHEVPVACVVGYTGGAENLVKDLGTEGKASDASGHFARYKIDGESVFIDALDDSVVLSSHPSLFDKSQDYLRSAIVGRKDEALGDIELVAYVADAAVRYHDELAPALEEIERESLTSKGLLTQVEQIEQMGMGLGLDENGAYFAGTMHAKPGSELVGEIDKYYGATLDKEFTAKLPASTFAFVGFQLGTSLSESERFSESIDVFAKMIAEELGGSEEKIGAELHRFFEEQATLYDRDIAAGFMHAEGTLGGAVFEVAKKSSGRDAWNDWAKRFTPEAMLSEKLREAITWKFEPAAIEIAGVEIDRWVLEPTAEGRKEITSDSDFAHLRAKWPEPSITIDRAELDDRVVFVVSPMDADGYMKSALEAVEGKGTIRDHAGYTTVEGTGPLLTAMYAVDVAAGANWLREIIPPREAADIPPALGIDLSDFTVTLRRPASGVVAGSMRISQPFLDQVRKLLD